MAFICDDTWLFEVWPKCFQVKKKDELFIYLYTLLVATISHKGRCFKVKELKKSHLRTACCTVPNTDGTEWPRHDGVRVAPVNQGRGCVLFEICYCGRDLNCKEEIAAGLQWPATHISYKEREIMVNWGNSEVKEILHGAEDEVDWCFSRTVNVGEKADVQHGRCTVVVRHLNIWARSAGSLWAITLWCGSPRALRIQCAR